MRVTGALILAVFAALPAVARSQPAGSGDDRAAVVAALERLMVTGEPGHRGHDQGSRLQRAVDAAFDRQDAEIQRLARRAARPLIVRITPPVTSTASPPALSLEMRDALRLPQPVTYDVEIHASVDGGELFRVNLDSNSGSNISTIFPQYARAPGVHHLRLQARLTYSGEGAHDLGTEVRNLPELVYALYDAEAPDTGDARMFVFRPARFSASRLDADLPALPFEDWLNGVLGQHGTDSDSSRHWQTMWCDERIVEAGAVPRARSVCVVAYFQTGGTVGQIWIRAGRIELTRSAVRWIAETPAFQAVRLRGNETTESDDLSALPALLAMDPAGWPRGDVSVAPEDIVVSSTTSRGITTVRVAATIRNLGAVDLRGVAVSIVTASSDTEGSNRTFVVDIPKQRSVTIRSERTLTAPYGLVFVQAIQLSEHNPFEHWMSDPTPDDAFAFRIVNPKEAPKNFADSIRAKCGTACRGF
jgi:hypothetical protein